MAATPHSLASTLRLSPRAAAPIRLRAVALERWHLLSLDAPTVATSWTWFVARTFGVKLPWANLCAVFLAVWILYALDRLLDARPAPVATPAPVALGRAALPFGQPLEPRHLFHGRHSRLFGYGMLVACALLGALLHGFRLETFLLYCLLGALLAAWLAVVHGCSGLSSHRLPKEFAVGVFFALAVAIPTLARLWALPAYARLLVVTLLFGALCTLNCLFIYAWEHPAAASRRFAHPSTRVSLGRLRGLAGLLITVALASAVFLPGAQPGALAIALSTALLLLLDSFQHEIAATSLRAAADLALLTPLLFAGFLR